MKAITFFAAIIFMLSASTACFGQLEMSKDKKGNIAFIENKPDFYTKRSKAMECVIEAMGSQGYDIESKQISSALIGTVTQVVSIEGDKDLGHITFKFVFSFRSGFAIFNFSHFKYKTEDSSFKSLGVLPLAYKGKIKKAFSESQYELLKTRINEQISAIFEAILQNCSTEN